jgi:mannose-1-phosphate guanylyltransferase
LKKSENDQFMNHTYAVIMAGGGGTRLWPISRKKHPKHILPLLGEETLFQSTIERLDGLVSSEHILVVTTAEQAAELKTQAPQIPADNFLLEPQPRGTASVVERTRCVSRAAQSYGATAFSSARETR